MENLNWILNYIASILDFCYGNELEKFYGWIFFFYTDIFKIEIFNLLRVTLLSSIFAGTMNGGGYGWERARARPQWAETE